MRRCSSLIAEFNKVALLQSRRTGALNLCFSFLVALAAVFLLPGWGQWLAGPQVTPAAAAYRFFWCYALLAILLWEFRCRSGSSAHALALWVGCAVWLIGVLWSAESAAYCSTIWLPAYALLVCRGALDPERAPGSRKKRLRAGMAWLALPPLLLCGTLGAVTAYYRLRLGHSPDWSAFTEYARAFGGGFNVLPMALFGPVWALFVVFCGLATTAVAYLRQGLTHRLLPLTWGALGALWAPGSYFVGRSHPAVAAHLAPELCITMAVVLHLFAQEQNAARGMTLVKMAFAPLLIVLLTATFGNRSALATYPAALLSGCKGEIEQGLPPMDASMSSLLNAAGVRPDDPIVYCGMNLLPARPLLDGQRLRLAPAPRTWLPVSPFALLIPLPVERREVYMARFAARSQLSGWLVVPKTAASALRRDWLGGLDRAWIYRCLRRTHAPTRVFENGEYKLVWFQYRGDRRTPLVSQEKAYTPAERPEQRSFRRRKGISM